MLQKEREREIQATEKTKPCPAHTQPLTNQHTIDGRTVHRSPQTQPTLFTFNINAIFSIRSQNISNIFFWTVHFVSLFLFSVSQTIGWQEAILSLLMCALLLLFPVPVVVLLFLYSYIFVLVFLSARPQAVGVLTLNFLKKWKWGFTFMCFDVINVHRYVLYVRHSLNILFFLFPRKFSIKFNSNSNGQQ